MDDGRHSDISVTESSFNTNAHVAGRFKLSGAGVARLITPCHPHQRLVPQNYTPPRRLILQ